MESGGRALAPILRSGPPGFFFSLRNVDRKNRTNEMKETLTWSLIRKDTFCSVVSELQPWNLYEPGKLRGTIPSKQKRWPTSPTTSVPREATCTFAFVRRAFCLAGGRQENGKERTALKGKGRRSHFSHQVLWIPSPCHCIFSHLSTQGKGRFVHSSYNAVVWGRKRCTLHLNVHVLTK